MPSGGKRAGAGRPSLPVGRRRAVRVVVRVTNGEREDWASQARALEWTDADGQAHVGVSVSEWVRRMVAAAQA